MGTKAEGKEASILICGDVRGRLGRLYQRVAAAAGSNAISLQAARLHPGWSIWSRAPCGKMASRRAATMRLEIPAPLLDCLHGKRQSFPRERRREIRPRRRWPRRTPRAGRSAASSAWATSSPVRARRERKVPQTLIRATRHTTLHIIREYKARRQRQVLFFPGPGPQGAFTAAAALPPVGLFVGPAVGLFAQGKAACIAFARRATLMSEAAGNTFLLLFLTADSSGQSRATRRARGSTSATTSRSGQRRT